MTKLVQFSLDQSIVDCGMSYLYELESGHFFLIDGGWFTPGESERLFQFMKERCGGRPHISGWFFSHAHQDHIGVFIEMMLNHHADLNLDCLIYNFQPMDLPETSEEWMVASNDPPTVLKFYEVVESLCANARVVTPHMNESMEIEELKLEFLFSHEFLDEPSTFNDCSTVVKVTACGQSVLFLGDIYTVGCRVMLANAPEKLKSDIVQVAHHGFNGATIPLYQAVGASVALWPSADYVILREIDRPENVYVRQDPGIIEHIVSGYGTAELTLPYQADRRNLYGFSGRI